jgi:hypothetical protein
MHTQRPNASSQISRGWRSQGRGAVTDRREFVAQIVDLPYRRVLLGRACNRWWHSILGRTGGGLKIRDTAQRGWRRNPKWERGLRVVEMP